MASSSFNEQSIDDSCILKLIQLLICNWSSKSPGKVLGSCSQLLAIQNTQKKKNDICE